MRGEMKSDLMRKRAGMKLRLEMDDDEFERRAKKGSKKKRKHKLDGIVD